MDQTSSPRQSQTKRNYVYRTTYIKLFLFGVVLVSIGVIILQIVWNFDVSGPHCQAVRDATDLMYFERKVPKFVPRPMANFFDDPLL